MLRNITFNSMCACKLYKLKIIIHLNFANVVFLRIQFCFGVLALREHKIHDTLELMHEYLPDIRPRNYCRLAGKNVVVYYDFRFKTKWNAYERLYEFTYLKEALKKYSHICFEFVIIDFLVTPTHLNIIIQCHIVSRCIQWEQQKKK